MDSELHRPLAMFRRILAVSCAAALGCGPTLGGGGPPPAGPKALTLTPAAVTLSVGAQQSFAAEVTGLNQTGVSWRIQETGGGVISPDGIYWAPAAPGTYHLTATSAADSTLTAAATLTVTAGEAVSLVVDPVHAVVSPGAAQNFSASVFGSTQGAVSWSIKEGGAGGSVSPAGAYTAPQAAGTYHLIATSNVDAKGVATAIVTVASGAVGTVALSPKSAILGSGASLPFGASAGQVTAGVTWSVAEGASGGSITSAGVYTAPASPGVFHVVATSTSQPQQVVSSRVTVGALPAGATVSGTIAYAGLQRGPLYVGIYPSGCQDCPPVAGTSLAHPGPFTLNAGQASGAYDLVAFLDAVGNQQRMPTLDPIATASVTLGSGTAASPQALTLTDPTASTPAAPGTPQAYFNGTSALVGWPPPASPYDHGRLYYLATTQKTCPTAAASYTVAGTYPANAGSAPSVVLPGLTSGSSYCFAASALAGGMESALSAPLGPVAASAPTGGSAVTGTVAFPALASKGALYVVLANAKGGYAFSEIAAPVSPQPFTVTGLSNGSYSVYAFLDLAGGGILGPGGVGNLSAAAVPQVTVGGDAGLAPAVVTLAPDSALANAFTSHELGKNGDGGVGDSYALMLSLTGNVRTPVSASLTAGPKVGGLLDVAVDTSTGVARFDPLFLLGGVSPAVGDSYTFQVTYSDGTQAAVSTAVTGVIAQVPTLKTPAAGGTASGTTPTFSWTPPAGLATTARQRLYVQPVTGASTVWAVSALPATQNSAVYDSDGKASLSPLGSASLYTWGVQIYDANGNSAQAASSFATP